MVKKLKEETGGKGMSMIGILAGMIQSVDGTCVAAVSESGNVRGVISTTGHGTADLSNMLGQFGFEVVKEGRLLRVGKGAVEGAVSATDAAEGERLSRRICAWRRGKTTSDRCRFICVSYFQTGERWSQSHCEG